MNLPTLVDIRAARDRIHRSIHRTPMLDNAFLSSRAGVARLALKCESFQKTGSFKARGALNALLMFDADRRTRGVVTVSAGNHAQALAWAAREVGIPCTVVMPATASATKAEASRGYGARVILHGTAAEAFARAH